MGQQESDIDFNRLEQTGRVALEQGRMATLHNLAPADLPSFLQMLARVALVDHPSCAKLIEFRCTEKTGVRRVVTVHQHSGIPLDTISDQASFLHIAGSLLQAIKAYRLANCYHGSICRENVLIDSNGSVKLLPPFERGEDNDCFCLAMLLLEATFQGPVNLVGREVNFQLLQEAKLRLSRLGPHLVALVQKLQCSAQLNLVQQFIKARPSPSLPAQRQASGSRCKPQRDRTRRGISLNRDKDRTAQIRYSSVTRQQPPSRGLVVNQAKDYRAINTFPSPLSKAQLLNKIQSKNQRVQLAAQPETIRPLSARKMGTIPHVQPGAFSPNLQSLPKPVEPVIQGAYPAFQNRSMAFPQSKAAGLSDQRTKYFERHKFSFSGQQLANYRVEAAPIPSVPQQTVFEALSSVHSSVRPKSQLHSITMVTPIQTHSSTFSRGSQQQFKGANNQYQFLNRANMHSNLVLGQISTNFGRTTEWKQWKQTSKHSLLKSPEFVPTAKFATTGSMAQHNLRRSTVYSQHNPITLDPKRAQKQNLLTPPEFFNRVNLRSSVRVQSQAAKTGISRQFKIDQILNQYRNRPTPIEVNRKKQSKTIFATGEYYEGEKLGDIIEGRGTFYSANGSVLYEGEWRNGMKDGLGVLFNRQARSAQNLYLDHEDLAKIACFVSSYEGRFRAGKMQGEGKLIYSNGDVFEGEFTNDRACGRGKFQTRGRVFFGQWREDKMVSKL